MYEIYAYGNNDSLYGIFNAIAAIISTLVVCDCRARYSERPEFDGLCAKSG